MSGHEHFRAMARNNAWSNRRLLAACARLSQEEFEAARVGFFPSLQLTLNHILVVDWYYLDALEQGGRGPAVYQNELPFQRLADLAPAQAATDARLVRYCDALGEDGLARVVVVDRGEHGLTREVVSAVLSHLFVHQIHHRGQAHAMLSGTRVEPPQLDEFFLEWDAPLRARDPESPEVSMRILGIEHVQLAMPSGEEERARAFYSGLLGIEEMPKPPHLASRGGAWFEHDGLKIHLGVDPDFRPARKAHPALLVEGLAELVARLRASGHAVVEEPMEGFLRVYVNDPFGNRIELMERE